MGKQTLTTKDAAAALGVSTARVRQMVLDGELKAEKFGRDLAIPAEAVAAAKNRKTAPGPAPKLKEEAKPKAQSASRKGRKQ